MTPLDYLEEIVLPTIDEFQADGSSRRKAYLACIVTYHLSDYLRASKASDVLETVKGRAEAAFEVVHAVATGAKHTASGRKDQIKFRAGSDVYLPPNTLYPFGEGIFAFGHAEGGIMIEADGFLLASVMEAVRTLVRAFVQGFHNSHFMNFDLSRLDRLSFPDYLVQRDFSGATGTIGDSLGAPIHSVPAVE